MNHITEAVHRLLDAVTDDGHAPENIYLLAVLLLVIFAGSQGWLSE